MKILIADDDPQILRALRITLAARGYDVVTAADGKAAVRLAIDKHPDLIVLDLGMPGLTGIEVIEALRGWTTGSDPRRVRAQRVARQGRGPRRRGRRLRHQAVPDRRAARPHARPLPPHPRRDGRTRGHVRRRGGRPRRARRDPRGRDACGSRPPSGACSRSSSATRTASSPARPCSRRSGGRSTRPTPGYLRLYISQLRKKLEPEPSKPRYLLTEAGMGYRFVATPSTGAT